MIGLISTMKVKDGKGEELEAIFRDLAPQVKANEPGNLLYQLTKSRTEPNIYKVMELYQDQDALTAHGRTDYFKATSPRFADVLAERPGIELLDAV